MMEKMKNLAVANLQRHLTVLEVAEKNLRLMEVKLAIALTPYDNERREMEHQIHELNLEIDAIVEASHEDPTVATLTNKRDEWRELYLQALNDMRKAAFEMWVTANITEIEED